MLKELFTYLATMYANPTATAQAVPPPAQVAPRVTPAPSISAKDAIGRVQAFYAGIKQVKATFQQTVTNVTFGSTQVSEGTMFIAKPGKMRWDYYSKPRKGKRTVKKAFISDGTTLWMVEHDRKQVVRKNLEQNLMPVAVTFLYGKGDLLADFNGVLDASKKFGAATDVVLTLTPKKVSAQYKNLVLVIDPGNYRVKESIIIDSEGNVNHFKFFAPDFAKPMQDSWFQFNPKSVPNYRVIDADADADAAAPAPAK